MIKSLTTGEVNVGSLGTFSALGLDFSGGLGLDLGQQFDPSWAYEEGAVGTGQGDDWEDAVDQEMQDDVKEEVASPGLFSPPTTCDAEEEVGEENQDGGCAAQAEC